MEGRLFEIKKGRGRVWWWLYACSMQLGLLLIWFYRISHVPEASVRGRWAWIAVAAAEFWFGFEWILSLSFRWSPIYRHTFPDRLSARFEDKLSGLDVFICTADPTLEPPTIVINAVLSVLAYDYPPEKLSVYVSDDGGSIVTFYALLEALQFAKSWIPFCKKFNAQPMSPSLFFSKSSATVHKSNVSEWTAMKKLYEDMECRIAAETKHGDISNEIKAEHEGFSEWSSKTTCKDHQAIVKILNDGRNGSARDTEGFAMPTFVYVAREKRQKYHHNFKAGALNALLRVSREISDGSIILTIDCDMCANSSQPIRDALCLFMDEERGNEYAFVQFTQNFVNLAEHDLYASSFKIQQEVYFPGLDGQGGPFYTGSCCFHRRECLNGRMYSHETRKIGLERQRPEVEKESIGALEDRSRSLATCCYEENTQWGNEMGVKYGCPVEDIVTGFSILCRGWKSAYLNPKRAAFLGLAPTTLSQSLVQIQRWSEGHLQFLLSKYCPLLYGFGRTKLGLQIGHVFCCSWALSSIPTLIYVVIPSVCILHGISVFPTVSSFWFAPFAFVIVSSNAFSFWESHFYGATFKCWWNSNRMDLYRRTTSYLFALVNTTLKLMGYADSSFVVTPKVAHGEATKRYEREIIEFGSTSLMFTVLSMVAMLNLFCLVGGALKVLAGGGGIGFLEQFSLQFFFCAVLVLINLPIYHASFFRNDEGRILMNTTLPSVAIAAVACFAPVF